MPTSASRHHRLPYSAVIAAALATSACDPSAPVPITIPGGAVYPEGVALRHDGTMFVGSVTDGTIYRIEAPKILHEFEPFAVGVLERGAIGMAIDEAHGVLLVCDSAPFEPVASAIVAVDLHTGALVARHPVEPAAPEAPVLCNDIAVDEAGTVYLSESFGGRVLRLGSDQVTIDGVAAQPWLVDDALAAFSEPPFGTNGIAVVAGELYTVNFNRGTLLHLPRADDGTALGAIEVALTDEAGTAIGLVGPDGIAASDDGGLLVVENGIFAAGDGNRLSAIDLVGDAGTVTTLATGFDIPTTVAEGNHHYWVVESQLDHLFGLDPAPPEPFTVVGIPR